MGYEYVRVSAACLLRCWYVVKVLARATIRAILFTAAVLLLLLYAHIFRNGIKERAEQRPLLLQVVNSHKVWYDYNSTPAPLFSMMPRAHDSSTSTPSTAAVTSTSSILYERNTGSIVIPVHFLPAKFYPTAKAAVIMYFVELTIFFLPLRA